MSKIFISYSRADYETTKILCKELQKCGHDVFLDDSVLVSGVKWVDHVAQTLLDAQIIIVLLSSNTRRSHWVQEELALALEQDGSRRIIPVLLDEFGKDNWVWPLVADRQAIDLSKETRGLDTVVASIPSPPPRPTNISYKDKNSQMEAHTIPAQIDFFNASKAALGMAAILLSLSLTIAGVYLPSNIPELVSNVLAGAAVALLGFAAAGYWIHRRR